jgi:RHS repeat-associated protein
VAEQRYYPYGEERWASGTLPTDRRFTGQRWEQGLGLYDYNARWYHPALGRFVSADTIVPEPGNPQSLNRFSYVLGNPLRYVDPTGYFSEEEIMGFFGVETWDEVGAIFLTGGALEGLWDWLSILKRASADDAFQIYHRYSERGDSPGSFVHTFIMLFEGFFRVSEDGNLYLEGYPQNLSIYEAARFEAGNECKLFSHYTYSGKHNEVRTPIPTEEVRWSDYRPYGRYVGLSYATANPDWDSVAADVVGIAADAAGPQFVMVSALATAYSVQSYHPQLKSGDRGAQIDFFLDLVGTVPGPIGVIANVWSLGRDFNIRYHH